MLPQTNITKDQILEAVNKETTSLDPNTNLPESTTTSSKVTLDDILTAVKYDPLDPGKISSGTGVSSGLNPEEFDFMLKSNADNLELRAQNQPTTEVIRNAIVNFGGGAILKTLQGAGYVATLPEALFTGDINKMLDNSWSTYMESTNEDLRKELPVYKTRKYLEGDLWEQMGTAGFWGEDLIDGLSFFASAWISGGVYGALSKSVGAYTKSVKLFNTAMKAFKLGKNFQKFMPQVIKSGMNVSKATDVLDFATIGAYNVVSEAAFEAKDVRDTYLRLRQDEIEQGGELAEQIKGDAKKAAFNAFKWNTIALLPSNAFELTLLFKRYRNLFKGAGSSILNPATGAIAKTAAPAFKNYLATFAKGMVKSAFVEGAYEENIQYAIQKMDTDVNSSFNYNDNVLDQSKVILESLVTNFRDDEGLKNIVLGALIGFLPGGTSAVQSKIADAKRDKAREALLELKINTASGLVNKYLKTEAILNDEGEPTGKFKPVIKDGGTIFDPKKIELGTLEALLKNNTLLAIMKAIGTGNEIGADYLLNKDMAENIMFMLSGGATADDIKNYYEFEFRSDLESLEKSKEASKETKDDLKKRHGQLQKRVDEYIKVYDSILHKHGGVYDFGKEAEDVQHRSRVIGEQYKEAIYQYFWQDKKDAILKELEEVESDTLLDLIENIGTELTDEQKKLSSFTKLLKDSIGKRASLESLEKQLSTETEEDKKASLKENIVSLKKDLASTISFLEAAEEKYNTNLLFSTTSVKKSLVQRQGELEEDVTAIKDAIKLKGIDVEVKDKLRDTLIKKENELANTKTRLELTNKSSKELVEIATSKELTKDEKDLIDTELTHRATAASFIDDSTKENGVSMSEKAKKESLETLKQTFDIDYLLLDSKKRLKDLLNERLQKNLWEKSKEQIKENNKKENAYIPEPTSDDNALDHTTANVIGKTGKVTVVDKFTEEDAKANGYEVEVKLSEAAARQRGENVTNGAKPSVYSKSDKANGRKHYIYTDGTPEAYIIREVDYLSRKVYGPDSETKTELVSFIFNNGELYRIRYTKKGNWYSLPKSSNPLRANGAAYEREQFEELFGRLTDYLPEYNHVSGTPRIIVPTPTKEDRDKVIEEIRNARASKLIKTYWGTDTYDNVIIGDLFETPNVNELAVFYNGLYGILSSKEGKIWFTPFAEDQFGNMILEEENIKYIEEGDTKKTFKTLNITAAKDTFLNIDMGSNGKEFTIEGVKYTLEKYNPSRAIKVDSEGNPISVTLRDEKGNDVVFKDDDIVSILAYNIELLELLQDSVFESITDNGYLSLQNGTTEVLISRKEGEYILIDAETNKQILPDDAIYSSVMEKVTTEVATIIDSLNTRSLYTYIDNKKELDDIRRINSVLRAADPEKAFNAPSKTEIQTVAGNKESETTGIARLTEEAIKEKIAGLRENIKGKEDDIEALNEIINEATKLLISNPEEEMAKLVAKMQANIEKADNPKLSEKESTELLEEALKLEYQINKLKESLETKDTVENYKAEIKEARAYIEVAKAEISILRDTIEAHDKVLKQKAAARLAEKKKSEKPVDINGKTVTSIELSPNITEITDPEYSEDNEYLELVSNKNGIVHSATAVAYVVNNGRVYRTLNTTLEDHVILNSTEGDVVVPYIKLHNETEGDNVEAWWENQGLQELREKLINNSEFTDVDILTLLEAEDISNFDKLVDTLPIGLKYKDSTGNTIAEGGISYHVSGFDVYIPLSIKELEQYNEAAYKKALLSYKTKISIETRKSRRAILSNLLRGNTISLKINKIGKGTPNNIGQHVTLASVLDKLGLEYKDAVIGVGNSNSVIQTGAESTLFYFAKKGNVYWVTNNTVNGEEGIIKLNPAKLSKEHAALALKILKDMFKKGGSFNNLYDNKGSSDLQTPIPQVEGQISNKDLLNLLVNWGDNTKLSLEDAENASYLKDKQLFIKNNKGVITLVFGTNEMVLGSLKKEDIDKFIDWATTNKNYSIDKKYLGTQFKGDGFKIGDLAYDSTTDNYTSFIIKAGFIKTDVGLYKESNSVYKQPSIIFDIAGQGFDISLTPEEEEKLSIKEGRIILSEKKEPEAPKKVVESNFAKSDSSTSTDTNTEIKKQSSKAITKNFLGDDFSLLFHRKKGTKIYLQKTIAHTGTKDGVINILIGEIVEAGGKRIIEFTSDHFTDPTKSDLNLIQSLKDSTIDLEEEKVDLDKMAKIFSDSYYYDSPEGFAKEPTSIEESNGMFIKPGEHDTFEGGENGLVEMRGPEQPSLEELGIPRGPGMVEKAPTIKEGPTIEKKTAQEEPVEKEKSIDDTLKELNDFFGSTEDDENNEGPTKWFRTVDNTEGDYEVVNLEESLAWLKETLGDTIAINVHKGLLKIGGNRRAFGKVFKHGLTLSDLAKIGTEYHEAFHVVSLFYLTNAERNKLYKNAVQKYKGLDKNTSKDTIEEFLAERFREFEMEKQSGKKLGFIKELGKAIVTIFNKLRQFLGFTKGLESFEIEQLFEAISKGDYKNAPILAQNETIKEGEEFYRVLEEDDSRVKRLFEINGVPLVYVKDDEQFDSIINGLLFSLVLQSNVLKRGEDNKLILNISTQEEIKKLNYNNLFHFLRKDGKYNMIEANKLNKVLSAIKKHPSSEEILKYAQGVLDTTVGADKIQGVIKNKIIQHSNKSLLYKEILDKRDVFLDSLEERLLAINISTTRARVGENIEKGEAYDDTLEDISKMASYNDIGFEHSSKDNTSTLIKLMLSLLPENNKIDPYTGMPNLIPFGVMWERVMSDFSGLIKADDIMARLQTLSEGEASYVVLQNFLNRDENVKTQFIRTIRKLHIDFINSLVTVTEDGPLDFSFQNAAVTALSDTYMTTWSRQMVYSSRLFNKGQVDKKAVESINKRLTSLSRRASSLYKAPNIKGEGSLNANINIFKEEFLNLFNEAGIVLNTQQLESILKELNPSDPATAFMNLLYGKGDFKGTMYIFESKHGTVANIEEVLKNKKLKIDNFLKNESSLRWLAEAVAKNSPLELGYSVFGPGGNRYYSIMANTYVSDSINLYRQWENDNSGEMSYLEQKLATMYGSDSVILNKFKTDPTFRKNFKMKTISAFIVDEIGDDGREYQGLTDVEDYMMRLNANFKGYLLIPSPADSKSIHYFQGLDKLDAYFTENNKIQANIIGIFSKYAASEHSRVELTKAQIDGVLEDTFLYDDLIESIHYVAAYAGIKVGLDEVIYVKDNTGKGVKATIENGFIDSKTDELLVNGKLVKKGKEYVSRGTQMTHFKNFNSSTINEDIEGYLMDNLDSEVEEAIRLGVITGRKDELGNWDLDNVLISNSIINHYLEESTATVESDAILNALFDSMVNTMYISIEMEKAFYGDPAAFETSEAALKRVHQYYSTGDNLRNDFPQHFDTDSIIASNKYNTTVFEDVIFESEYYDILADIFTQTYLDTGVYDNVEEAREQATEKLKGFKKTNETDGQTFILPSLYRALSIKLGEWNGPKQIAFDKLMGKDFIEPEEKLEYLNTIMQPLKMQYLKVKVKNQQMYTVLDKMSLATLFPALVEGTRLQEVYERMEAIGDYKGLKKIHQVKFKSAQKSGVSSTSELWADSNRSIASDYSNILVEEQDFDFLRYQLNTTPHEQQDYLVGSQVVKAGMSDVSLEETYDKSGRTGITILNETHSILNSLSDYGKENFKREIGLNDDNTIIDKGAFIQRLQDEAIKANLPSFLVNSFKLDDNGRFYLALDAFPGNRKWIQSRLISLIKKSVADLRLPGGVFYQMTSAGFENRGTDLQGVQFDDRLKVHREDGLIEAKVSIRLFKDVIPNYNNKTHEERVAWMQDNKEVASIHYNTEAVAMSYRIPTQGQNSEYMLAIVDYMREEAGNVIVLAAEGTTIGGFDFDIDKLYIVRHNYDRRGNRVEYSTATDEASTKARYINWVNEQASKEIKNLITELTNEDFLNIKEKYSSKIEEIKAFYKETTKEEISEAKENYRDLRDEVEDSFLDTPKGRELENNFREGLKMFRLLPNELQQRFRLLNSDMVASNVSGGEKTIRFREFALVNKEYNSNVFLDEVLSKMITLYDEQLELFGNKLSYIKERSDALLEAFKKEVGGISDFNYELKINSINEEVGNKNNEFLEERFKVAETLAEESNILPYDIFKITNIVNQNTKKAIQNRLIDNYMEIYTDPKHIIFRYQPLDYGTNAMADIAYWIADATGEAYAFDNTAMRLLSPSYQIAMKAKYSLGNNLGIFALSGSHHSLGQRINLGLFDYIGIGNSTTYKGKKVTDLSKVYSIPDETLDGKTINMPITEWLSSLINAHVDLASNPYLSYLNVTKENSDVVSLLIRAGMGLKTFWFTSQPVLKELSSAMKNRGNRIGISNYNPLEDLINKYKILVSTEFNAEEEEKGITNKMEDIFNVGALKAAINTKEKDSAYYDNQLRVLLAFKSLMPYADSLREAVLSSRDDTKKSGSSNSQMLAYELKKEKALGLEEISANKASVRSKGNYGIRNFSAIFEDTFLKSISTNTKGLTKDLLQQVMMEATDTFETTLITVLEHIGKKYNAMSKTVDFVSGEMYAHLISDFFRVNLGVDTKEFNRLVRGTNSVPRTLLKVINGSYLPGLQKNKLIKSFIPIINESTSVPDKLIFLKPESKWSREAINRAWASMFSSPDIKEAEFAVDLFIYSYLTSGFKNGIHTYFDSSAFNMIKYLKYDKYIEDKHVELELDPNVFVPLVDRLFLSGWRNDDLVPPIKFSRSKAYGVNYSDYNNDIFTTKDPKFLRGVNTEGQSIYTPYLKRWVTTDKVKKTKKLIVYKFYGLTKNGQEAVYHAVNKLGTAESGHYIREDILDQSVLNEDTKLNPNKVGDRLRELSKKDRKAKSALAGGVIQITNRQIDIFVDLDEEAIREIIKRNTVGTPSANTITESSDGTSIGGFSEEGRGTKEGDAKDAAMREKADGFLGEVTLSEIHEDGKNEVPINNRFPGSTGTSAVEINKKTDNGESLPTVIFEAETKKVNGYSHTIFSDPSKTDSPIIMLARNGNRKGYMLNQLTKDNILNAHNKGATFILGDMPGVDEQFLDYLNSIGAKYVVYHGEYNRLANKTMSKNNTGLMVGINEKYTKATPANKPNTVFVYTENITNKDNTMPGKGSAVIRGHKNAIGIITKKRYVYKEDRLATPKGEGLNLDFDDTLKDFELFVRHNREQFAKIESYLKENNATSIVFPKAFAAHLAALPLSHAKWLSNQLYERYGLVTTIFKRNDLLYKPKTPRYGLKSVATKSTVPLVDKTSSYSKDRYLTNVYSEEGIDVVRKQGNRHFGNPYQSTNGKTTSAPLTRPSATEAAEAYIEWLDKGLPEEDKKGLTAKLLKELEERRQWILNEMDNKSSEFNKLLAKGKKIVYYYTANPYYSHADALAKYVVQRKNSPNAIVSNKELNVGEANVYFADKKGEFRDLSNFTERPFNIAGKSYNTVEEYFQLSKLTALKLNLTEEERKANDVIVGQIKATSNPYDIKRLGGQIKGLDKNTWEDIKADRMKLGMLESFKSNPKAAELLISTEGKSITHINLKGQPADDGTFSKTIEEVRDILIEDRDDTEKEKCNPTKGIGKAALGLAPTLTMGGTWGLVKDLKGLPTHTEGGVQLSIKDGKTHFTDGDSTIHAKEGLILPNINKQ